MCLRSVAKFPGLAISEVAVLVEGDFEHPMEAVLDREMGAHGVGVVLWQEVAELES